jgi:hypothetical protein
MSDGRIMAGPRMLGSGFVITARAVITADHVVRGVDATEVVFQPSEGPAVAVERIDRDSDLDVAVLFLSTDQTSWFVAAPARIGAEWRVTAQPVGNDPRLTGTVTDTARSVDNAAGTRVDLLQLRVDQELGSYRGYSGSAVLSAGPAGGVIGVLVEQVPLRQGRGQVQAGNVLYALPLQKVLARFDLRSGLNMIPELLAGLSGLGAEYAVWIENFLVEYLGRPGEPVPFGGRDSQLSALSSWLTNSSAAPYALLAAEAGRGKSALLATWAAQVCASGLADVVFVPVSLRFNTAQAGVALPALAARLATYHGESASTVERSAEQWQAHITTYLRRMPRAGKPLLVIVDGLDEATDWEVGAHLFPATPPPGVRVLVSARYIAGDLDDSGWRNRLNWVSPALATSIALPPLDMAGVGDVLHALGNPLAHLVSRVDIVGELHRLSGGDPLLVRLYVDELRQHAHDPTGLTPEELPSIERGMAGYFGRWRSELERVWRSAGHGGPGNLRNLQDFLNVLASALGPLTSDDLAEVNPETPTGLQFDALLSDVARFVIGDGARQGFVFSHPRFGTFFHEAMGRREQQRWSQAFTDYGGRVLAELRDGARDPTTVSSYVLTFYGAHLESAGGASADVYALLDPAWLAAWHAVDGTDAGFLNDCDRAWRRAEQDLTSAAPHDREEAVRVQFVSALARGSVAARSSKVPPRLLVDAVREGVLTAAQALATCRRMRDEKRRADAVVALAPVLPDAWIDECLAIAATMREQDPRARAIVAAAHRLSGSALPRAQSLAETLTEPGLRAWTTAAISARLAEPERTRVATAALSIVDQVERTEVRGRSLAAMSSFLPAELVPRAIEQARQLPNHGDAARAVCALAWQLPEAARLDTVEQLPRLPRSDWFLDGEVAIADHLPALRTPELLQRLHALDDQRRAASHLLKARHWLREDPASTSAVLLAAMRGVTGWEPIMPAWAGSLTRSDRAQALADTPRISDPVRRAKTMAYLLAASGQQAPEETVADALRLAASLEAGDRAFVVTLLASTHPAPSRRTLLGEALRSAQTVDDIEQRITALSSLISELAEGDLALAQAELIALDRQRAPALRFFETGRGVEMLGPLGSPEVVAYARDQCLGIHPIARRVLAFDSLSRHVPKEASAQFRELAIAHAALIADPHERLTTLSGLSRSQNDYGAELEEALLAAVEQQPADQRPRELVAALPRLTSEMAREQAVRQFLSSTAAHDNHELILWADFLNAVPNGIPENLVSRVIAEVRRLPNGSVLLPELSRLLPPEELEEAIPALRAAGQPEDRAPLERTLSVSEFESLMVGAFVRLPAEARVRVLPHVLGPVAGRVVRIVQLAPVLPPNLHTRLVMATTELLIHEQVSVYPSLHRHLPADVIRPVLTNILAYPPDRLFVSELLELADHVPAELHDHFVESAIQAAAYDERVHSQLRQLGNLVSMAPASWRPRVADEIYGVIAAIREFPNFWEDGGFRDFRAQALAIVAGRMPRDQLDRAIELAAGVTDLRDRLDVMDKLLRRGGTPVARTLWPLIADTIGELRGGNRAVFLVQFSTASLPAPDETSRRILSDVIEKTDLASVTPGERAGLARLTQAAAQSNLVAQAIQAALQLDGPDADRALEELVTSAANIPNAVGEVLQAIARINSDDHRGRALATLAARFRAWPEEATEATCSAWTATIRALAERPRAVLVNELASLARIGSPCGVPPRVTLRAFVSAVAQVGDWWN